MFNTHLNKGGGQKIEAIFRVIGSVAWMAAVRAGHPERWSFTMPEACMKA